MHNGVASTFSIAYRESFRERESGRVSKEAGAINAFTFGIGCISNAAAAFSSLPLSHSPALPLSGGFVGAAAFLLTLHIY